VLHGVPAMASDDDGRTALQGVLHHWVRVRDAPLH
jgi:hypothetical protein